MTMDERYGTMYRSTAMNFNNASSENSMPMPTPESPQPAASPASQPSGLSFQPATFGGTPSGYGMSLPERRPASPGGGNAGGLLMDLDDSMPDPQKENDLFQAGNGMFRSADGKYLDKDGNPRDEYGQSRLTFPSMGDTPHDGRWANPPGTGLNPSDYPGLDASFYQNPETRLDVRGYRQKQRETLTAQQQQAQHQQQLQARQQLLQQQALAAQSQAAQQPQQQPHPQAEPETDSNALTDILKGTWKALTEGGAAAVEAGGKAWDEKDKVMDGAELGFKMAGPVVESVGKTVLEDTVANVVQAYLGKIPKGNVRTLGNVLTTPETLAGKQFAGAKSDTAELVREIQGIVNRNREAKH